MDDIVSGDSRVEVIYSGEVIAQRLDALAREIAEKRLERLLVVAILKGSFVFAADLIRALHRVGLVPEVDFLTLSSYRKGARSSGRVEILRDIETDVKGRNVLIVDDILESGRTLAFAKDLVAARGATSVDTCVLLDKPVPRIQGAEVYKGYLYAARDNYAEKSVIAIDPVTGHVSYLFNRDLGLDHEVEGMTFVTNDQGTTMRLSDIDKSDDNRVDVTSYRIAGDTTPPELTLLRKNEDEPLAGQKLDVRALASEPVTIDATWSRCLGTGPRACRRTGPARPAPPLKFSQGSTTLPVPTRTRSASEGKGLGPGRYRLELTPVDIADATGEPITVTTRIRVPRR